MRNELKMPQAFSRARIQGDETVGEQIVAQMGDAGEIRFRASRADVGNVTDIVHGHAGPAIGRVVLGVIPRFITEFAGMRDGVKSPQLFASGRVESPNVLLKTGHDDDFLEHGGTGAGRAKVGLRFAWEQGTARIAKVRNQVARPGVQSIQIFSRAEQDGSFAVSEPGQQINPRNAGRPSGLNRHTSLPFSAFTPAMYPPAVGAIIKLLTTTMGLH